MDLMSAANYRPSTVSDSERRQDRRRLSMRRPSLAHLPQLPPSLVRLLLARLERHWYSGLELTGPEEESLAGALYKTRGYLRRREPNEMEEMLTTIDHKALDMISTSFHNSSLNLAQFAEAVVKTGTYDADRVLAFVGGVVDLFLEVLWSQAENAREDQEPGTVNWCQLMNHFIESPEIAMYESSEGEVAMGFAAKAAGAVNKQVSRNTFVDRAKHMGSSIEKLYWIPNLDMIATIEGTESVYLWSPTVPQEMAKSVTPEMPQDAFTDHKGKPLFKVLALDWDPELMDIAALLSNRMLIIWRLRNKERAQFQQKRELRFDAKRCEARGDKEPEWKVFLNFLDPRTMENMHARHKRPEEVEERGEVGMRRDLREQRLADEASSQLNIWFNHNLQLWVTTTSRGMMYMWDLRRIEGSWLEANLQPTRKLPGHTRLVTSHLELSRHKFTTTSLDRTVLLWDNRNLSAPEMEIKDHAGAVLSQAYLPLFSMLVSVGCEKTVYCWTIDSTAYRGVRKKLGGHQSNLSEVAAGSTVFFTLDEGFIMVNWDALTLIALQTISCRDCTPRHIRVLSELGKICVASRRLNFFEGNEHAAIALGAAPVKDSRNAKNKQEEGASLKDRAPMKWAAIAAHRGTVLSATEAEVRLHTRGHPQQFKTIFSAEGDAITDIAVADRLAFVVVGTASGGIHFLKYRSGCARKVYHGRRDDGGTRWVPPAPATPAGAGSSGPTPSGGKGKSLEAKPAEDAEHEGGAESETAAQAQNRGRVQHDGRTKSPAGNRSPANKAASAAPTPQATAKGLNMTSESPGEGLVSEEEARDQVPVSKMVNAPSPEELVRGLSRKIKCVLPCEDERRIYVGTAEGQVIIFKCDSRREFPVERWATCPDVNSTDLPPGASRADAPPVTCLHCTPRACVAEQTEEEAGLLIVGTRDGVVHLYNMVNLKLAGSINIPRALPSEEGAKREHVCHIRLFDLKAEPDLPLTMLTVDGHSQIRLWGFKIHVPEWKLVALKLILDAGQLLECHSVGGAPQHAPVRPGRVSWKDADNKEASGKSTAGQFDTMTQPEAAQRSTSSTPVNVMAVASLPSRLKPPPETPVPRDGPHPAHVAVTKLHPEKVARKGAEANGRSADHRSGWTPPPSLASTAGPRTPKGTDPMHVSFREDWGEGHREVSGTESEGDADELVGRRLVDRPQSPPRVVEVPPGAEEQEALLAEYENLQALQTSAAEGLVDGRQLVFLADSGGWIWCVDIAASLEAALERHAPLEVCLKAKDGNAPPTPMSQPSKAHSRSRSSTERRSTLKPSSSDTALRGILVQTPSFRMDETGMLMTRVPPRQRPEVIKVLGAWPAHPVQIVSLTPLGAPPALVSTDANKEVKVWSCAGDLWGHFSTSNLSGAPPPTVAVWPPPHVLAAQLALMKTAKALCKKMGFPTRRSSRRADKRMTRRTNSKLAMRALSAVRSEVSSPTGGGGFPSSPSTAKRTPMALEARGENSQTTSPTLSRAVSTLSRAVSAMSTARGTAPDEARERVGSTGTLFSASGAESADGGGEDGHGNAGAQASKVPASTTGETVDEEEVSPTSAADSPPCPDGGRRRKAFSSVQMNEMIRHHAFSSGFDSYSQFVRKGKMLRSDISWRARIESGSHQEAQRNSFLDRTPSAFGVELYNNKDVEAWESGVRSLGPKSSSEGALLRYAHTAVEQEAKWVREALGVDITKITKKQIRSPSFLVQLDSWPVSVDPRSPQSATAQAVKRVASAEVIAAQKVQSPATPPLVNAGAMTMASRGKQSRRR